MINRYGSNEMHRIWSDKHRLLIYRSLWIELATMQNKAGIVSDGQLCDLESHATDIDLPRSEEIEASIHHDLMAQLITYAEQCSIGGPILHLGATSADITCNADIQQIREAVNLIILQLRKLLLSLSKKIETYAQTVILGYTHLQPAEPTTLGYRLAQHGQDLYINYQMLTQFNIRSKGFKGAVGTGASYLDMSDYPTDMSHSYPITTQTYPLQQDLHILNLLADIACSLHRFAINFRIQAMQNVLEEPYSLYQIGSSAMPWKHNPILSENICSLARYVSKLPSVAWDNASHAFLERSLDDSANRRIILPDAFLAVDEMIHKAIKLVTGFTINMDVIDAAILEHAPYAATERIVNMVSMAGGDRQKIHERIRQHAIDARLAVRNSKPDPFKSLILADPVISDFIPDVHALFDITSYTGHAESRALQLARIITEEVKGSDQLPGNDSCALESL